MHCKVSCNNNIPLPGRILTQSVTDNIYFESDGLRDDDEFFHLTCHVEPTLVAKIERGEFVELEKLLPKNRSGLTSDGSENRTELIFREGKPVIVPHIDRSRLITGIRKWEQAFRIYAAIYSKANPSRSAEIWQYVFVINTAAASHPWFQVADYDFAFRQTMGSNPKKAGQRFTIKCGIMSCRY